MPAILVLLLLSSCVYFNTIYNAKRLYREAEKARTEALRTGSGITRNLKDRYKVVVIKCSKVLRDHPNSGWVDDSIFLMGKALVRQQEYNKGIRKFQELITNYPESKYVSRSLYWLALANYEKKEYNQALMFTRRFIEGFSKHELRHKVIFLAGDINLELEKNEDALNFYSMVADESSEREVMDEALLKSARLHYRFEDWENAASSYKLLLKKGISWELRYDISLALGECYAKIGKCREAIEIFDEILPDVTKIVDKGPVMLGKAEGYECMDSLETAIIEYRHIIKKFPRSDFAAKAYYKMGLLYHEKLDSLQMAEEAFSNVGKESSKSEFASLALQKSTSIRKLMELQNSSGERASEEQMAGARFSAAEIQLTRLGETEAAIENYMVVIDSFPETSYAPVAAYAMGWIYQKELEDKERALEAYRRVILKYPRSLQARGALEQFFRLGDEASGGMMQAYIDSALADTAAIAAEMREKMEKTRVDSIAAARKVSESFPGTNISASEMLPADSLRNSMRPVSGMSLADSLRNSMRPVSRMLPADYLRNSMRPVRQGLIDSLRSAVEAPASKAETRSATVEIPADTIAADSLGQGRAKEKI